MIELTCWGCGWEGRVPESYAGLLVWCRKCGSSSAVPDRVSEEIEAFDWSRPAGPAERRRPAAVRTADG